MQSNATITDSLRMGDLDKLPIEIIGEVVEKMTVRDVLTMMSLNKHSYATLTKLRQTVIPTFLGMTEAPKVNTSLLAFGTRHRLWVRGFDQPDNYRGKNFFKLLRTVARSVKDMNFGDVLNATKAKRDLRCAGCEEETNWIDASTREPLCEKCAVWKWSPYRWNDKAAGIDFTAARGKECVFINFAASRECQEQVTQGWKNAEVPFIK